MLPPCYETGDAIAIWYRRIKGESYVKTVITPFFIGLGKI